MSSLYIPPFGGTGASAGSSSSSSICRSTKGRGASGGSGGIAISARGRGRLGGGGGGGGFGGSNAISGADASGKSNAIAIRGGIRTTAALANEGKAVSRQLSRSYFVPRSLEGYERHLRQIQCEGYLQRQSRTSGTWRRRWFLLKDGYLSYFQDQEEAEVYRSETDSQLHHHPSSQRQLSLDCVEAVRTEEKIGPLVFRVISSHRDDLVLRAESKERMNDWLFGFHRALAGIIAQVIENKGAKGFAADGSGGEPGEEDDEFSHGFGFGDRGAGDGTGGGERCGDGDSERGGDPFRVTGGNVIRKVMGHGHGRARRLSLRQCRLGNTGPGRGIQKGNSATAIGRGGVGVCGGTAGALSMFGGFDGGSRNGPYSNGRSAPDMNFAGGDSNAGSSSGITSGNPGGTAPPKSVRPTPMATSSSGLSQSNSHCCRSGDKEGGARVDGDSVAVVVRSAVDGGVDSGGSCHTAKCGEGDSCVQPSPSRQARVVPLDERRRRTESLGSWGGFAAVDGGGIAGIQGCGQVDCSGGGGEGADWADVKGDIREDQDLIRELDDTCGERSQTPANEGEDKKPRGVTTPDSPTVNVVDSSGDEGRSSESGQGSTSDECVMDDSRLALTSEEAMGLSVGMDVEPHSLLAAVAQEDKSKYDRAGNFGAGAAGGIRGGGGGKYIPPAMRAAARAKAEAAEAAVAVVTAGSSDGEPLTSAPPSPKDALQDEEMFELVGVDVELNFIAAAASSSSITLSAPLPDEQASSVSSLSPSPRPNAASCHKKTTPISGKPPFGGGGGATCAALSRGGRELPWAPANKEFYYTGDYHCRRPCNPEGTCNRRGGGCGGGPASSQSPPSTGYRDEMRASSGNLNENFGVQGGVDTRGEAQEEEDARGLWWSCGAWSIMGRREKQEDRFCVMPDYNNSLSQLYLEDNSSVASSSHTAQAANPTCRPHSFNSSPTCSPRSTRGGGGSPRPSGTQSSPTMRMVNPPQAGLGKGRGDGKGAEVGMAQGFFGVYDGHCGSEAVQFVRDRLHSMVGEHASFWEEPEKAMKEAFLSADEEFLSLAGEKDWYSGTTVLVALMRGRNLLIGNLGDGEAVLCRGDEAVHMSPIHNPAREDENARIIAANGWVTTEQELFLRQLKQMDLDDPEIRMAASEHVRWNTITRVCGELAVSRSIGDRDFKGFTRRRREQGLEGVAPLEMSLWSWPQGHSTEFRDDLLTAEPEFAKAEIGEADQFLLMACDGLWDVLGKVEAVKHAKNLFEEGLCAQAVAERMCELAYRMGTSDNVTVVIIEFHHYRPC